MDRPQCRRRAITDEYVIQSSPNLIQITKAFHVTKLLNKFSKLQGNRKLLNCKFPWDGMIKGILILFHLYSKLSFYISLTCHFPPGDSSRLILICMTVSFVSVCFQLNFPILINKSILYNHYFILNFFWVILHN